MDSVTHQIDEDKFQSLEFESIREQHPMESHTLSPYALKASNLLTFKCSDLGYTTDENRASLLDMTEKLFVNFVSLRTLKLSSTCTGGSVGRSLLQALADSDISSLKSINLSDNPGWFRGEQANETTGFDLLM